MLQFLNGFNYLIFNYHCDLYHKNSIICLLSLKQPNYNSSKFRTGKYERDLETEKQENQREL